MHARIASSDVRYAAASIEITGVPFTADASGALYWDDEKLLLVATMF